MKSIPLLLSTVESTVKPCAALSPSTLLRNKCNGQLESSEASSQANFRLNKGKARPQYFQKIFPHKNLADVFPEMDEFWGRGYPQRMMLCVLSGWLRGGGDRLGGRGLTLSGRRGRNRGLP